MSSYYTARGKTRQFSHKIIMLKKHEIIKLTTKQVKHATSMIHMLLFTLAQYWFTDSPKWPVPAGLQHKRSEQYYAFGYTYCTELHHIKIMHMNS